MTARNLGHDPPLNFNVTYCDRVKSIRSLVTSRVHTFLRLCKSFDSASQRTSEGRAPSIPTAEALIIAIEIKFPSTNRERLSTSCVCRSVVIQGLHSRLFVSPEFCRALAKINPVPFSSHLAQVVTSSTHNNNTNSCNGL